MRLPREVVLQVISVVFLDICVVNGSRDCPVNCKLSTCNKDTRFCSLGCEHGYHGNTCNKTCDVNCENKICQHRDGSCVCSSGYIFHEGYCTSIEVSAGAKCKSNNNCLNNKCVSAGRQDCLEGCKPLWYGHLCTRPCSVHCSCDKESGNCTSCIQGWYGAGCELNCSAGCLNKNCHRNGTCVDGCTTGLYGEKCALNCSPHCVSGCKQLSGQCVKCEAGRYGSTCQCSAGCEGTTKDCYKDGTCIKGCKSGYFGKKCESTCPEQCDGDLCNMTTGVCTTGCESGYFGSFCNLTCVNCQGGDCDARKCRGTYFPGTWISFIIGGGLLLIFVVLAVFMTFCLKRMRDIMKDSVHLIGRNTAVHSVPDHGNLLRSVDTLHTGSKACGGSSDDMYDHLFAIKPPGSSICLDDLETSSGYCAVRPLCGVSDQLLFESDDVSVSGSYEEGDIGRSLISLCERTASDHQVINMDEATAFIAKDDVTEPIKILALQLDENVITDATQKITLVSDEEKLIPEEIKVTVSCPEKDVIAEAIQKVDSPSDTGASDCIMVSDEDKATSMGEAADGGPSVGLGEQDTEENSPSAVEDGNISVFTYEDGSINDSLINVSDRGKHMKPKEQGGKQYVEVIVL